MKRSISLNDPATNGPKGENAAAFLPGIYRTALRRWLFDEDAPKDDADDNESGGQKAAISQ